MKTNWLWDTKLNDEEARMILRDEKDPRFYIYVTRLLSRVKDQKAVFDYVGPDVLRRQWPLIKARMLKDAWARPAVVRWQKILMPVLARCAQRKDVPLDRLAVAAEIRQVRMSHGLSQEALAQEMGVIQQYVSNVESGRENLTVDTLNKIAQAFHKKVVIRFVGS